ncbi:MAG: hypothetical protein OXI59_16975, partial [Gemmatimonadota bacterium]|nr:hypothetical protein [Gemmatimonadota bacterium]
MKYLYYLVYLLLIGVPIAFSPADVSAGTVGKLNGVVADVSGAPLPGTIEASSLYLPGSTDRMRK